MTTSDPLRAPVEVTSVDRIVGPLMFVTGAEHAGWDEHVLIRLPDGSTRNGTVIDVDRDLSLIEVFEGTDGIGLTGNSVAFTGTPVRLPVTDRWLGRTANGRGEPIDGGPPVAASRQRMVSGSAINPARRAVPRDPVLTGVSVIDALTTLVRGQKLPIFSVGGLPHLELAIQIAAQANVGDAPFNVVFAGIGLTNADADLVRTGLESRVHRAEATVFLNTADDPTMERILTPRLALTVAEHLAFEHDRHVLVVLTDMTSYADALRQLASARGEVPSRRGYPGYLFSDLAGIYERCGRLSGRDGSITEVPVLTMPAGDITHPVPDVTGYITEGQIVLSPELHARDIWPPVDALSSLSRLMRRGVGRARTRADHQAIAAQVLALLAHARQADQLAALIGSDALSITERRYLDLADRFEVDLVDQGTSEARSLDETLDRAWRVATTVPSRELTMIDDDLLRAHAPFDAEPAGRGEGRETP